MHVLYQQTFFLMCLSKIRASQQTFKLEKVCSEFIFFLGDGYFLLIASSASQQGRCILFLQLGS